MLNLCETISRSGDTHPQSISEGGEGPHRNPFFLYQRPYVFGEIYNRLMHRTARPGLSRRSVTTSLIVYGEWTGLYSKLTEPASRSGDGHPQPVPEGGPLKIDARIQSHHGVNLGMLINLVATG
jgi:hypothetical protein